MAVIGSGVCCTGFGEAGEPQVPRSCGFAACTSVV